jgi:ketosteroid isomerase-like protein
MPEPVTDEEVAALVRRVTEAADALIRGDVRAYAARIKHADDYTLMPPYGGDTVRGFDDSDKALDALAQFFRGGEATVEVVETYASGDLPCSSSSSDSTASSEICPSRTGRFE